MKKIISTFYKIKRIFFAEKTKRNDPCYYSEYAELYTRATLANEKKLRMNVTNDILNFLCFWEHRDIVPQEQVKFDYRILLQNINYDL